MQPYMMDNGQHTGVEDFQIRDRLIETLRTRFTTYGYKQIRTSTFESYDLYADFPGTVNKDEMIKVIDTSGKVMVLRPDVTIPISRMTALNSTNHPRVFYVLDVFRQTFTEDDQKERTQAGIEYFDANTPQSNAEVLMLAVHTLKDLGFSNFKIEIGHAGFFKELVEQAAIEQEDLNVLLELIQSKNTVEIKPFLEKLPIASDIRAAIQAIPLLYGDPLNVIKQAKEIIQNEKMQAILRNLIHVYDVLKDYQAEDNVVFNLGLVNHMDYYTGIIFQGFVNNVGKPVLMGGRYDNLIVQNDEQTPAIGFAFEVDYLVDALHQQNLARQQHSPADMVIYYEIDKQREALAMSYQLREEGYQVLTFPNDTNKEVKALYTVHYINNQQLVCRNNRTQDFTNADELIALLQNE
ncbi:ATP phosphoribosyltransferase regulatory subunit [Virgibacillus sp. NKC19-3]|uniref:ATP phosphoribosyltransferase regulatory subunit n=1 Tax=Virgibacillus saliphilus TaxID=2831674 RepID=UPI001C9B2F7D|nr:ATP phosphoribosyltransferase regulatory subunit [Virgibacillus sp. NKC19-3]MBY7142244.1 ATP phosphoribosyltransferase regulatory subunit [Virgibacillus sp. NKC19-3]